MGAGRSRFSGLASTHALSGILNGGLVQVERSSSLPDRHVITGILGQDRGSSERNLAAMLRPGGIHMRRPIGMTLGGGKQRCRLSTRDDAGHGRQGARREQAQMTMN